MHSFRARPLTWLFFAATACLDAIALATDNESDFANALGLGQLFVASGWLVVGHSHRLIRAAVFVATIGLLAAPDLVIPRIRGGFYADLVWPHMLALLITVGIATVAATLFWLGCARLVAGKRSTRAPSRWQFPVVEIFGWMIVVAVASAGARLADFSLIRDWGDVTDALHFALVVGGMMALGLGDLNGVNRAWHVLAAVLGLSAVALVAESIRQNAVVTTVGPCIYIALWILVRRLDK